MKTIFQVVGKVIGEEIKEFKKKDGTMGKSRNVGIVHVDGGVVSTSIEIPMDYVLTPDKNGVVTIPNVEIIAQQWTGTNYQTYPKKFIVTK